MEDGAEFMADESEVEDMDDMDEDFHDREIGGSDSEADEYDYEGDKDSDTSSAQARKGRDIQGIPWDGLSITRERYRQTRLEQYKNYENIPNSGEHSVKGCKATVKGGRYYDFRHNYRSVKSTILHFQLRNLVWASSKHDVYLMSHFSVIHWSSLTTKKSEVLNVAGHVAPSEKHPGSILEGFTETQVSTLAVKDSLLVAGGFQGELICKRLDRRGVSFCTRTTYDENAITNAVEIYDTASGATHFTASNNDCVIRDFDIEKFQLTKQFQFPWPVNAALSKMARLLYALGIYGEVETAVAPRLCGSLLLYALSIYGEVERAVAPRLCGSLMSILSTYECLCLGLPDPALCRTILLSFKPEYKASSWGVHTSLSPNTKLLAIVGDDRDAMLVDSKDGKTITALSGHLDYSFASAWHPDGVTFATGNQDKTCRVWDVRNPSKSLAVLKGNLGAIRSIRYTSDGRYLAMAEPADFVHIFDAKKGYETEQEIDFFGEISGISFSPDTESLFIGVWDRTYGSLLEYGRRRNYTYLDSFL